MNSRGRQRGITLLVITLAMATVLIAITGLALDISRLVGDKARLQLTVDAAALAAAKILDTTGSVGQARVAADTTFAINRARYRDLQRSFGLVTVEYSSTITPFVPGSGPPQYVRVNARGFNIAATFSAVVGFNFFDLNASAMAGPSPTLSNACNLAPMMLCGVAPTPGAPIYGYAAGNIYALQPSSGTSAASLGLGYFFQQSAATSMSQSFAGAYRTCSTVGALAQAQASAVVAPVAQGLDTRFNEYTAGDVDSADYPPDVITTQPAGADRLACTTAACTGVQTGAGVVINNETQYPLYSYEGMYLPNLQAGNYTNAPAPGGNAVPDRRVLAVPVGNCGAAGPGANNIPVIGLACMFMLQDVDPTTGQVFAEAVSNCQVNGNPGPLPNNAPGPYSIQLYHVTGSPQS